MKHKSGFVNIIGNPNVGKSTLMNAFVGEKLSIITSKAQTTRHRIFGIVSGDDFQVVFSDTPGIIKPAYELQHSMMDLVKNAFEDADILIYMVEIGEKELKDEIFFQFEICKNIFHILTSKEEEQGIMLIFSRNDLPKHKAEAYFSFKDIEGINLEMKALENQNSWQEYSLWGYFIKYLSAEEKKKFQQ